MPSRLPVVFLPGLLSDAALWRGAIQALEGVIAPQVAAITRQNTIEALARSVLVNAPPQFALVALSMGGYVAFEILRQAPERVLKLCLFDTSARADTDEQKERRRLLIALSRSGEFKGVTPRLLPMLIHANRLQDDHLTGTIMAMAERVGREAFQNQQTAIMNRIDSRPFLPKITCPTHIIGGHQDALTPPAILQEIAQGIRGSHLTLIENCGHLPPLEQPETANRLLRAAVL